MSVPYIRVQEGGWIVIPAALRRKYGFDTGKTLVVEDAGSGMTVRSLDDVVADGQAIMAMVAPAERCLSDEIIDERREEALRE